MTVRDRYAERFVGPFSKVYHLASLAAKRAETIVGIPEGFPAAVRAGDKWR
jgi:hypothetical protein